MLISKLQVVHYTYNFLCLHIQVVSELLLYLIMPQCTPCSIFSIILWGNTSRREIVKSKDSLRFQDLQWLLPNILSEGLWQFTLF